MNKKTIISIAIGIGAIALASKVIKDILDADRQERDIISLEDQKEEKEDNSSSN